MSRSEVRDGMRIEWDVPIEVRGGTTLRCDVFRPDAPGAYPVLLTHGPYAKGLSFQEGFAGMWNVLANRHPDALAGSTNKYQVWETPDPEKWVPDGYICVRVDSRGAGRSPGYLDIFSKQETQDYYDCIEWAGVQPWSNGRVGLLGISYYASNQWQVAALNPPHLAAICPWEGASDYYREFTRHGGILSTFFEEWYPMCVGRVQHGLGENGLVSTLNGELVSGPETLGVEQLSTMAQPYLDDLHQHDLLDDYYRERTADLASISVPMLSATNWAHHLHTRGNFEGYLESGSPEKWLEVHGLEHYVHFYTDYGVTLQKRFFGHFLKGEDTGWTNQPPVTLNLREVDGGFIQRAEQEWPLDRTQWTNIYLDGASMSLAADKPSQDSAVEVDTAAEGVTFELAPFDEEVEITGPISANLHVSSSTVDADVFVTVRLLDLSGADVTLRSALDPSGIITAGWLRASHRKLDPERSTDYRPVHPHDERQPLTPGEVVELQVEVWPTSLLVPVGYRLSFTVSGQDFEFSGEGPWPQLYGIPMRGQGIFLHNDPIDRPAHIFGGITTLYSGPEHPSSILLPIIPRKTTESAAAPTSR